MSIVIIKATIWLISMIEQGYKYLNKNSSNSKKKYKKLILSVEMGGGGVIS